ncbi:hypothetical protein VTP01DRAFT_3411 [Rhizomucor pusillus]|uniref:uncharacterized protein n=1 Tax=Rhizomucor pusillus TaxID=4840 RepID=UPI003743BFE5
METAVRKATRLEYSPPKQKHLNTLVSATHQNPACVPDIMALLEKRLKENSWIIVFKVLIIAHTLIREAKNDAVIEYLFRNPGVLDFARLREKSSNVSHIVNIRTYKEYLNKRIDAYGKFRVDHVKATMTNKVGRLRHLSVPDGLLKETTVLQDLIQSILNTRLDVDGTDNAIGRYAYRLVLEDLLVCFQSLNESIVNILEHYFAMNKTDARTSLGIYKRFARQTEETTNYLDRMKRLQNDLNMNIPMLKHAPLSLANALEEYLNDANTQSDTSAPAQVGSSESTGAQQPPTQSPSQPLTSSTMPVVSQQYKSNDQLIDFFGSVENEQTSIFRHAPSNPTPFVTQQFTGIVNNAPQPQQPQQFTGTTQPITMSPTGSTHNPFRFSTLLPQQTGSFLNSNNSSSSWGQMGGGLTRSATVAMHNTGSIGQNLTGSSSGANPFRANTLPQASSFTTSISNRPMSPNTFRQSYQPQFTSNIQPPPPPQQQQQQQQMQQSTGFTAVSPQLTGNPFMQTPVQIPVSNPAGGMQAMPQNPMPTGSSNPFLQQQQQTSSTPWPGSTAV